MDKITDFIRLLKSNYSTDVIYFERIAEKEINKPVELFVENEKIVMYHKITGTKIGDYAPSDCFTELVNAFIVFNSPALKLCDIQKVRPIFEKHKIKSLIN